MCKEIVIRPRLTLPIFVVLIFTLTITGCTGATKRTSFISITPPVMSEKVITPADSSRLAPRGFFMGLLPTPAESQSFADVYYQASQFADFSPVWGRPTPFYNMAVDLSGDWGQTFVEQYIRANGMFPIIDMSFIGTGMTLESPPDIIGATLANPAWRNAYKQSALNIVRAARPLYLSLGNEVNRWYEQYGANNGDPNGFQYYVSLYNEIYDAIKEVSPQTKVFCIFAREIVDENRETDLKVVKMFDPDKMDMLIFTSYPNAVQGINSPSHIPDDYYSRALQYMPGKPFGFSEVGWPALDAFGGEQGQADFIGQVVGRLTIEQGVNLQLFGWPWLSALDGTDPMALIKKDGSARLAYYIWQKLYLSGK